MKLIWLILLNASLAGDLAAQAASAASSDPPVDRAQVEVEPGKSFIYKQSEAGPQRLEVYYPPAWTAGKRLPAIILFHGGGWSGGDLRQFRYACRYFASRGLVAITAEYQLAKREEAPARKRVCVTDVKSALRWVKLHAAELGVDSKQVISGGGSAGGHIALLATLNPGLDDPSDAKDVDTTVVAYVFFNPAFDPKDAGDPEVDALRFLRRGLPPMIIFFGTDDPWKPGSDRVREKLKSLGGTRNELWLAKGQHHGFFNKRPWLDLTLAEADRFLADLGLLHGATGLAFPPNSPLLERAP